MLLIRHGLAGESDPERWPDDDMRPLTEKGRKAFKRAAKGLARQGVKPLRIYTSPAVRTRQTALLLAKAFGLKEKDVVDVPALHHSRDPGKAVPALAKLRPPRAAALVGHEPWLGIFLASQLGCERSAEILFTKGGAALVKTADGAPKPRGKNSLMWLLTQDQLADLG